MSPRESLGLFPLNAVLFPGALLPLHVFEARYKQLIGECIASGGEFGVNLMDGRKMHDVGCGARVVEVVSRYNDGRMDVVIQGTRRYRVGDLDAESQLYVTSDVEWLEDVEEEIDQTALRSAVMMYNELVTTVYNGRQETIAVDDIDGDASFKMAQKAGLELQQRQHLLTINSENERLAYLNEYLEGVLPKIKEAERIQGIIRNDGYL